MTSQQHNELWLQFHDVVIHDNTAKTNRYEMALSLFPIVLYMDGDPAMIAAIQIVYPQTQHLLCIYHIIENVKKKARFHGDMVKNFIRDFYYMRNSYTQTQFDLRFNDILSKYESCHSYLENKFYPSHRGILLLKDLVKVVESELEKELQYTQIKDYYSSNPSVGLPSTFNTIFKEIDNILQAHLSPIPLSLQRAQME
ncbi:unnamed protein product [Rhizophagus irregularis]|nr:unnamed protein product [Rhizophagus irregularis]